ncbi:hypothetical protein HDU67_007689 [Dinochytrium kinnereticum]|nr:hypothetical protein HDU67_007689 [Dinochytrium kinnereticum]
MQAASERLRHKPDGLSRKSVSLVPSSSPLPSQAASNAPPPVSHSPKLQSAVTDPLTSSDPPDPTITANGHGVSNGVSNNPSSKPHWTENFTNHPPLPPISHPETRPTTNDTQSHRLQWSNQQPPPSPQPDPAPRSTTQNRTQLQHRRGKREAKEILNGVVHQHTHDRSHSLHNAHAEDEMSEVLGEGLDGHAGHHGEPMLVSLRVCKQCQSSLMGAFEHCLSRHANTAAGIVTDPSSHGMEEGDLNVDPATDGTQGKNATPRHTLTTSTGAVVPALMESIHQIDEVEDGKRLTDPPYFEIIHDPTEKLNTVYNDFSQRIERDRYVFYESKAAAAAAAAERNVASAGKTPPRFFSGALYKRTLEAKDKEIRQLREKLYDRTVSEKREHSNVEKLKVALNRSMRYYMYAEEWQMNESSRLQQDVRYLKAEMSSLMAFLINSEEEKRMLLAQIEEIKEEGRGKDAKITEMEQQKAQLKSKLHDSFREFLVMSETIGRLKKEAEHGSDSIISRNEILQRNLDKLSRDFERASQDLAASQTRVKELEFELEEIVIQFNITGEAKRIADDLNVKLTSELDAVTKENQGLKFSLDAKSLHAEQLERELRELSRLQEQTKYELENKAGDLARELEITSSSKRDLEAALRLSKNENERLSSALKSLTRSKDQLETAFRSSVQKHDKEVSMREEKITELQNQRSEDTKTIRKLQETKEQLMFQVTDLQNNLDRELANVNILSFELAQLKRTSEERTTSLEEQVEKLNAAKINLANDKRLLTDKIRLVRADLKKKEDECDELHKQFDMFKDTSSATESTLRLELQQLHAAHNTLTLEHKSLEHKQTLLIEHNVELSMKQDALMRKQAALEEEDRRLREEIAAIRLENESLAASQAAAITDRNEMKIHLDSVLTKIEELKHTISQEQQEAALTIKEKTDQIVTLTSSLYHLQEEEKKLNDLCKSLKIRVEILERELADTKAALEAETYNREQFEMHCYDLRTNLNAERRLRLEFERMQSRIDKRATERVLERIEAMKIRDRRMNDLAKSMKAEQARLKELGSILPTEADLVVIEAPELSQFLQNAATMHPNNAMFVRNVGNADIRPDMRVTVAKLAAT